MVSTWRSCVPWLALSSAVLSACMLLFLNDPLSLRIQERITGAGPGAGSPSLLGQSTDNAEPLPARDWTANGGPSLTEQSAEDHAEPMEPMDMYNMSCPGETPQCRAEFSALAPPHCGVDCLPMVGDEYLTTNWSHDAPEPPLIGCNFSSALFTGANQFYCEREEHVVRTQFLRNLTRFLDQRGIPYFLSYGTLLGAYRHGTFSWWDDDADIVIREEDREALLRSNPEAKKRYRIKFIFKTTIRKQYEVAADYLHPRVEARGLLAKLSARTLFKIEALTPRGCHVPRGKQRIYADIFLMSEVRLPVRTGLYTFGHDELFSYADIFPTKDCWLGGYRFSCPQRTRVVLTRMYKDLGLLHEFNSSKCKLQQKARGSLDASKWRSERFTRESYPEVPLLRSRPVRPPSGAPVTLLRSSGPPELVLTVYVPEAYEHELEKVKDVQEKQKLSVPWNEFRGSCNWRPYKRCRRSGTCSYRKNLNNSDCISGFDRAFEFRNNRFKRKKKKNHLRMMVIKRKNGTRTRTNIVQEENVPACAWTGDPTCPFFRVGGFTVGELGHDDCPPGTEVVRDSSDCQDAAQTMGFLWSTQDWDEGAECFVCLGCPTLQVKLRLTHGPLAKWICQDEEE